ncbi:hypothetical protein [Halobacteriovorax sp. HLS]|uniref:hypothetical protein n=1 Tax=Halobacteriovorax sp. HLS TaxID=2234000 RepID=UPI000FD8524B|nr:hypothetical protein [Halobacteriovorax sp. HLS]
MENTSLYKYEIKVAKTEHKVPVVNDVHIHSIYNPVREAVGFIAKNKKLISAKNEILILGLGFGYHVSEAIVSLKEKWGTNYKIIVIEPNEKVYRDYLEYNELSDSNLSIYAGYEIKELYKNRELVNYLLTKPGIIAHPASFNLYEDYYKNLLSYQAPKSVRSFDEYIESVVLRDNLKRLNQDRDIVSAINESVQNRKEDLDQTDHFFLAYNEMIKGSLALEEGNK